MAPYVAKAEVLINAPIDLIWSINLDLAKYKEWNPFIYCVTNIPHQLAVGSMFEFHVRFANGFETTTQHTVTALEPPNTDAGAGGVRKALWVYKFSGWLSTLGIVKSSRYHWLEQKPGSAATLYRTEEAYTGLGAPLVPLAQVQDGFQRHAVALKNRAEAFAKAAN